MMEKQITSFALKYPRNAEAPIIVAKEKGLLAKKMVEIARENNVPVVEDQMLSQVLTVSEMGECIPEDAYEAVAKIFAFILKTEK